MHAELNKQVDEEQVKEKIIKHLSELFEAEFVSSL